MKKTTILIAFHFIICYTYSQEQIPRDIKQIKKNLKTAAKKAGRFFLNKEYETYAEFVLPALAEKMGGVKALANKMRDSVAMLEKEGIFFNRIFFDEPIDIVFVEKQIQAVIPETIELKNAEGTVVSKNYCIGISDDGGATWHFIAKSGKSLSELRELIPTLDLDLTIPPGEKPVFYRNKPEPATRDSNRK